MRVLKVLTWLGAGKRGNYLLVAAIAFSLFLLAPPFLTFEPYRVSKLEVIPREVCPSQGVRVEITRDYVLPKTLYGINYFGVESNWKEVKTGAKYPAYTGTIPVNTLPPTGKAGRQKVESDLVREPPTAAGTYVLETTYTIRGRVLYLPASDYPTVRSSNHLRVLPPSSPACEDGGMTDPPEKKSSEINESGGVG